jgi:hypothetical protein
MPKVHVIYRVKTASVCPCWSNDLRLTIAAVVLLTLASFRAQEKKSAANSPQQSCVFDHIMASVCLEE